jgi:hypothetical protein
MLVTASLTTAAVVAKEILRDTAAEMAIATIADQGKDIGFRLLDGISGMLPYSHMPDLGLHYMRWKSGGTTTSEKLKEILKRRDKPRAPLEITVEGVFLSGSLLSFGWWEREDKALLHKVEWKAAPGIQRWLFNGFEQWAPSWDINDWSNTGDSVLLGQIGTHDEAESVPVLIEAGEKAKAARDAMRDVLHRRGSLVASAKVTGLLCPAAYVEKHVASRSKQLVHALIASKRMPKYCIVVQNHPKMHKLDVVLRKPVELYSGYIWRCYCPENVENDAESLLPYSYFVWEHTDFSERDAVNYNLDSLNNKVKYLQHHSKKTNQGNLVLLQHMMPEFRLRGDKETNQDAGADKPFLDSNEFLKLFAPLTR